MNTDLGVLNGNPLLDPPPVDRPLVGAPLELVVTQVRFMPVVKMDKQDFIADFQERIRKDYPAFTSETVLLHPLFLQPVVSGESVPSQVLWRMFSLDSTWRVILTRDFLALETSAYISRADFLVRWKMLLDAFTASFRDITGTRFGLRYVNRLKGNDLAHLSEFVRPEARALTVALGSADVAITEAQYPVPEGRIRVRWGDLPPNVTHDPSIMPAPEPSWILDTDLSLERIPLDLSQISELAAGFSARGYAFFHWIMTDRFRSEHSPEGGSA